MEIDPDGSTRRPWARRSRMHVELTGSIWRGLATTLAPAAVAAAAAVLAACVGWHATVEGEAGRAEAGALVVSFALGARLPSDCYTLLAGRRWSGRTARIVGAEPSDRADDMRRTAAGGRPHPSMGRSARRAAACNRPPS